MKNNHYEIAELYKALGNPKRLQMLAILEKEEKSVDLLSKELKLPKANVSQHLSILRHLGIVKPRREGLSVFYALENKDVAKFVKMDLE